MIFRWFPMEIRGLYFLRKYSKVQLTQTNNLPQAASHPMLPLLLFFPFFHPLPLFFFLLFHHPQSPEKRTQHLRALFFQHAALDLHLMVNSCISSIFKIDPAQPAFGSCCR